MQETKQRRSNKDRSETTRSALIVAARALFVARPYADIGTPELAAAAGLTRGALYHHFEDKKALFRAVVEVESALVAAEIERAAPDDLPPVEALIRGGEAFIEAMAVPGRTRLLLLDAPAVLGRAALDEIDGKHAGRTLREGLEIAMTGGAIKPLPLDPLTRMLSAVFDRAALAIEAGDDEREWLSVIDATVRGLS